MSSCDNIKRREGKMNELKMNKFDTLTMNEMMTVDGGNPLAWMAAGFVVDGMVKAGTGKSASEWAYTYFNYATKTANSRKKHKR